LLEFADNGITPLVSPSFKPEFINVTPLRDRYIKLHHTLLSYIMMFLRKHDAMSIDDLHLSPQHHADSKGKPEGRIIGDLSGQHDKNFRTTKTIYGQQLLSNGVR